MNIRFRLPLLSACLCWCLCCCLPAFAQPMDMSIGALRGMLRMQNGLPCPNVNVMIKVGDTTLPSCLSNADGVFFANGLPEGAATVSAMGASVTTTIQGGRLALVQLVVQATGVIVTLHAPMPLPETTQILGGYKAAKSGQDNIPGFPLGTGAYWFPSVPAEITSFAVVLRMPLLPDTTPCDAVRQQWDCPDAAPLRALTMTIAPLPPVRLALVDAGGNLLPNCACSGTLVVSQWENPFWLTGEPEARRAWLPLRNLTTDATGLLTLGAWPAGGYRLTLYTPLGCGIATPFTVAADGAVSIGKYAITRLPRTVTQTVFTADGAPAAGAALTASYAWAGQMVLRHAQADNHGVVTWPALPPTRVIVWGAQVPPGILLPDAVTVEKPLTPLQVGNPIILRCRAVPAVGGVGAEIPTAVIVAGTLQAHCLLTPNVATVLAVPGVLRGGTPISLIGLSEAAPPRGLALLQTYLPYPDVSEPLYLDLPVVDAAVVRGRCVAHNGKTAAPVSRLSCVPLEAPAREAQRLAGVGDATLHPDGTFDLVTPILGDYAAQPDLFAGAPPESAPRFPVSAGRSTVTVPLPDPLFTVPAHTELHMAMATSPAGSSSFAVAGTTRDMPVYGPAEAVLACWYMRDPAHLVLWRRPGPARTLVKRTLTVTPRDAAGAPLAAPLRLRPLLPPRPATPEDAPLPLSTAPVSLWTGAYTAEDAHGTVLGMLQVPAAGDAHFTPCPRAENKQGAPRQFRCTLPAIDHALTTQSAPELGVQFDTPDSPALIPVQGKSEITVAAPQGATKMTLSWLGVGYLRDIPLPADHAAPIALPAWQRGVTVSATLLDADGRPIANHPLLASLVLLFKPQQAALSLTTDAQGKLTLSGVMPGPLYLYLPWSANWCLQIPEAGLKEVPLRVTTTMTSLAMKDLDPRKQTVWWQAQQSRAQRVIASFYAPPSTLLGPPLAPGFGALWLFDPAGGCRYQRLLLQAGANGPLPPTAGPALGLLFPLSDDLALPGRVTFTGHGLWQGVSADFPLLPWRPYPELGLAVAQLDAVPPGPWLVRVETSHGPVESTVTVTDTGGVVWGER